MESIIQKQQAEVDELNDKLSNAQKQIAQLKRDNTLLEVKAAGQTGDRASVPVAVKADPDTDRLRKELARLHQSLGEQAKDSDQKVASLRHQLETKDRKLVEELRYSESQKVIADMAKETEAQLRKQIAQAEKNLISANKQIARGEKRLAQEQSAKRSAEARLSRAKEELKCLEAQLGGREQSAAGVPSAKASKVGDTSTTCFEKRVSDCDDEQSMPKKLPRLSSLRESRIKTE